MNDKQKRILVIGYGEMGHAMEYLLGNENEIVVHDSATGQPQVDLKQVVPEMDVIILCTPTAPIYEITRTIKADMASHAYCMSMGKALDAEGRTAADALKAGLGSTHGFGVLYGPMIAEEILAGRPAFATYAASALDAFHGGLQLFENTRLYLQAHTDPTGAAWCAVIKNVYAMLFGMADELDLGLNMRGFLTVACLREMSSLVVTVGGQPKTPQTLAGLGDLVTTSTSEDSHHHSLGRSIARGDAEDLRGEGIATLDTLARLRPFQLETYPLIQVALKIIHEGADPEKTLASYVEKSF